MLNKTLNKTSVAWRAGVFFILIFADQLAKHFARHIFRNGAFAFSIPLPTALIYIVYLIVLAAMAGYCAKNFRKFSVAQQWAWLLIFSGAVSNIAERLVLGYVRDFIYIVFYKWTGIY